MNNIKFNRGKLSNTKLIELYKSILYPRLIEEKMLLLLRQNKISKWFSGIGQEAVSTGIINAMNENEYVLPMHRNLSVFTNRGISLKRLFAQWQGKEEGFTKGRDRSFHFGTNEHKIVGMISHLGPQLGVADGIALAEKLKGNKSATVVFTGDGGTSEGDFHEAVNVASVWDLPVLFVIENNGYGLSTPSKEQINFDSFVVKGPAYGIEAFSCDGNNIIEVYETANKLLKKIRRNSKPIILECRTFRMRGHEESSGTKYIPKKLMEDWAKKDPIKNYEAFLLREKILTIEEVEDIRKENALSINNQVDEVFELPEISSNTEKEIKDVYKEFNFINKKAGSKSHDFRLIDALRDALHVAMESHENLILMGQDISDYGGVFKVTQDLHEQFGKDRVRNTPLCESAILGTGLGLSVKGYKAMVEMQFADFVSSGFTQIVNNLAKIHYRWGQNADVVVRMPTGAGVGAGPFHSQSNESWFFHTAGLKIAYPSNPFDAKGLLLTSFEDPNPVMFFEHKNLYRSIRGEVPEGYYNIEFGKGKVVREGNSASIITYGSGVHWAKDLAEKENLDIEIIDLRTLVPMDHDLIEQTVLKTNKVLVLHEDNFTGGIGAEISAWISKNLFRHLDAPVYRVGSLDTPVPFAGVLEKNYLANARLKEELEELLRY